MKTMQSRRTFLKGAGITVATAAALGVSTATAFASEAESSQEDATNSDITWEDEYDVIVVGAGLAGSTAALTVATEGDGATCLVVEKGPEPIGNSPFALGTSIYLDKAEDGLEYLNQLMGDSTPEDVQLAFAEGMAENIQWLKDVGAKEEWLSYSAEPWTDATGEYPEFSGDDAFGKMKFSPDEGPGHVQKFVYGELANYPDVITLMTETTMEDLIQDPETKRIIGITANGKNYKANQGVIMCCGGFESDPEMLVTYTGVEGVKPYAGLGNTGDGHRACMKVGCDLWHMHGGAQYWMAVRDLENTQFIDATWNFTTKQNGITVGSNGRRFYMDYDGCVSPTPFAEPDSDIRTNVGYRHGITQFGGEWGHLPMPSKAWFIFDQAGLDAGAMPPEKSADPVADGWAYTADTLEDLAAQIDVPADELAKTVEIWNGFCEGGEDLAFYRPADTLTPVSQPPYYAMMCVPAMLNTDGGPRRSANAEILDPDGNPIPGLYSAGEFGSVWGHLYQGAGNLAECLAFGRIAARSALA